MLLIFVVIAFVCLSIKLFDRVLAINWCFEKFLALAFFTLALLSLFGCVMIDGIVCLLFPLAFILVANDTLNARPCCEPIN